MGARKFLQGWIVIVFWGLFSAFSAFAQIGDVREYVIGIGDQLNINVWGIPELSSQVSVRLDGKITIPRLGDVQAAGLKISSLKAYLAGTEEGKETIGKYVTNPNITLSLVRSSSEIRITISGAVSQTLNIPRQTSVGQVLKQLVPQLPMQPPPNLKNILVMSAEGEEFPVNWPELQAGQNLHMDVRLEWGDEIRIPAGTLPEPTPAPINTPSMPSKVSYSEEELLQLLQEYPDALEVVMAAAASIEEGVFHFDLAEMSEEQQAALGKEIIALLFYGRGDALSEYFTNITLLGLAVNLRVDEVLEAYLAFPAASPETLLTVKRFREGDRIETGAGEDEDIYLEEIRDDERVVVVRQGDKRQLLSLTPTFSEVTLTGIFELAGGPGAVFSNLPETRRRSRKTRKRMFLEGEELEEGVTVADISEQWVILQKGEGIQLLLLRDSLNRPLPEAPGPQSAAVATSFGDELESPQKGMGQLMQNLPQGAIKNALPAELRALNSFSELFFATPIFE